MLTCFKIVVWNIYANANSETLPLTPTKKIASRDISIDTEIRANLLRRFKYSLAGLAEYSPAYH